MRSGRGSSPTASQSPATARHSRKQLRVVGDGHGDDHARGAGGEGEADVVRSLHAPGDLEWHRHREATRPIASRFAGRPARAPSMSTMWISCAPAATNRSAIRSGRSVGDAAPVAAPGQWTMRERPFSTSIDGMTSTTGRYPFGRRAGVPLASAASSRRWKLIGREPLRSSVSWKRLRLKRSPRRRCSSARSWSSRTLPSR